MANYLRRLVSGAKARFSDEALGVELDLIYLNDQILIMGYPAQGVEALYRNPATDAERFLTSRHEKNFWVFNLCPLSENSYPSSLFHGRVSRYPFPDHHAPPLALLPLACREMILWLQGSVDRVVVLHCKAGKGRSGTLACALLLALNDHPSSPQLQHSYTSEEWARRQVALQFDEVEDAIIVDSIATKPVTSKEIIENKTSEPTTSTPQSGESPRTTLDHVLDLHTSRRMKPEGGHRGVSIPSQRRFLYYWSLFLSDDAPAHFWSMLSMEKPRVRLQKLRVRMQDDGSAKLAALKVLHSILDRAAGQVKDKGDGTMWVSLARYSDEMVDQLERWEKESRSGVTIQCVLPMQEQIQAGEWDEGKMIRTFARFGAMNDNYESEQAESDRFRLYTLYPLPFSQWVHVSGQADASGSGTSFEQVDDNREQEIEGIIVDAGREVRAKLYIGQLSIGWFWFIPAFHMDISRCSQTTRLVLQKSDIDFPIGMGAWLFDVEVSMSWVLQSPSVWMAEAWMTVNDVSPDEKQVGRAQSVAPEDWDKSASDINPSQSATSPIEGQQTLTNSSRRSLSDLLRLHAQKGKDLILNEEEERILREELGQWINADSGPYEGRSQNTSDGTQAVHSVDAAQTNS